MTMLGVVTVFPAIALDQPFDFCTSPKKEKNNQKK